jgi:alpha-glucosidase
LYRRLLQLRRGSAAIERGSLVLRDAPESVVAYERTAGAERVLVLVNFGAESIACPATGTIAIASDGVGEGGPYPGALRPDQAIVLR